MRLMHKGTQLGLALGILLLALLSGGCSTRGNENTSTPPVDAGGNLPNEQPGIAGIVTRINPAIGGAQNTIGHILVEENPADTAGSAKASVAITTGTRIVKQEGADLRPATFGDLATGQQVRVWFSGPVLESYPVQGQARFVVIIGS